jgi:hypothetical protein
LNPVAIERDGVTLGSQWALAKDPVPRRAEIEPLSGTIGAAARSHVFPASVEDSVLCRSSESVICKQEVAGSIPVGSTREVAAKVHVQTGREDCERDDEGHAEWPELLFGGDPILQR